MKRKSQLVLVGLLLASLLLSSCGGGETPVPTAAPTSVPEPTTAPEPTAVPEPTEVPAPEVSADTTAILDPAGAYFGEGYNLITAEALYENLNDGDESNDPYIIDIRKAEDYDVGHISGAVNIGGKVFFGEETLATLPTDGQIVVTCYTGQTAGQVVGALNTLGYDAYSLKFGMISWAIAEDAPRWNDGMSMAYPADTEAAETEGANDLPAPIGAEAYFGEGFQLITAEALYENLNDGDDANDPFVIDIRKAEDYAVGHIPGAVNIGGKVLFGEETLATLPTGGQIVVTCYTGQTAGQVVGTLNTLGYDAYSLKFGMISWAIAEGAPRWNDGMSMAYPADTEAVEMAGSNDLPTPLESAHAYFAEGFQLITAEALYENLNDGDDSNDPYILDIRSGDDYAVGHVPSAVNVGGGALFNADTLAALPTDGQVVVACYSGQTAGQVVGVLNMLGYDAYSLKFGYPSWTTENVAKGLWRDDMSMDYPVESGAAGGDVLDAAGAYFGEGYQLITAEALYENLNDGDDANDPVILDIRKAEDYGVGHVPGAVNMGGGAVFSAETLAALPADGQVVVYCYTGQTAGQVVGALNLLGYDAYSMKFGMPSWAIAEDAPRWNSDMSMSYPMDTEAAEMAGENAMPAPVDAAAYFGEGFQLITAEALYENLNDGGDANDPAILDIRSGDDYVLGHIPGAVSVGGGALFNADTLNDLPTDGQVVVYCYSGQTAGQVVGALNLLGYDAYSLKFGYPSWTTENVSKGLWNDDISMGYPIDTEVHELP